jgi:hypothetical protein
MLIARKKGSPNLKRLRSDQERMGDAGEWANRRRNMNTGDKNRYGKAKGRIEETAKRPIRDFRDLDVYQNALETGLRVYELSKKFPDEERYALTDQIRRSSRSVCANIAEAWRKRRYTAAFISKLSDCEGEAAKRKCTSSSHFVTATSVTPNSRQSITRTNTSWASSCA